MPVLLDAIRHAETGHLSLRDARNARSKKDAIGPYQFLEKNLHDMGYQMPRNINPKLVHDPVSARELAERYVTGYSNYHGFTTALQQLAAYNMGPTAAEAWLASGGRISDLPKETQEYVQRAAAFLNKQQPGTLEETTAMAMMSDGYDLMRQLGYNEQEIAAAKRKGVPAEFFEAKQGLNQGVLAQSPEEAALANDNTALRGVAGVLNDGPIRDITVRPDTRGAPTVDMLERLRLAREANALGGQLAQEGGLVGAANAATTDPALQFGENYAGVLNQIGKPSGIISNRRDQSPMSYKPGIDMNDMLIRVGLAGVGASGRGGLEAFGAMGEEFGNIQDTNNQGLAAFQQAMAKGNKGGSGIGTSGSIIVNDSISRALPLIGEGWSTGFASYLKGIPGSDAQKLANNLKTIQANIGFDKLQAMRDASPTGGALGQVSERELGFLQSVFGSLDQSQTAEELQYNLQLLQYVYNSIVHGEGNHQYQMPVYGAGSSASDGLDADLQADIDKYANQ